MGFNSVFILVGATPSHYIMKICIVGNRIVDGSTPLGVEILRIVDNLKYLNMKKLSISLCHQTKIHYYGF
jgi:hypothetical protein